eukprot:2596555-Rhodomonas_salina.1
MNRGCASINGGRPWACCQYHVTAATRACRSPGTTVLQISTAQHYQTAHFSTAQRIAVLLYARPVQVVVSAIG